MANQPPCHMFKATKYAICIRVKTKSYPAQESVSIHSGLDSKVMHSFKTRMHFPQSRVMIMNTSPVHRMWHLKARYARDIHSSQLYHRHEESIFRRPGILVSHWPAGLGPHSLAGWGGVGVASGRQHTFPNRPEVCPISFGMAIPRFSKCIPPSIARIHLL